VRAAINPLQRGDNAEGRWTNGVWYIPHENALPGAVGVCNLAERSNIPLEPPSAHWVPYAAYTAVRCAAAGFEKFDFMGRAQQQLEIGRIKALERELWAGDVAQSDPQYVDNLWLAMPSVSEPASGGRTTFGPIDVTPASGPVTIKRGFGALEQALADYGVGARGMIHVRPEATPNFTGVRREGNLLLTQNDTIVVPGGGYPNMGPGGAAPAAGNTWMYATGLVEVRIDDAIQLLPDPTNNPNWYNEALDRKTNTIVVWAQQLVLASWDGLVHFAVQAVLDS
jgi:hypothetical protein